jgi:hypothetical protein
MKRIAVVISLALELLLASFAPQARAQSFFEGFNNGFPVGWATVNLSTNASTGFPWGVGNPSPQSLFFPYEGVGWAASNWTSIGGQVPGGVINNWLFSPVITGIRNGDVFSFYTRTFANSPIPDRLELRLSAAGSSTNAGNTTTSVGDFTTLLASVNPTLALHGYPETWTLVSATVSGLTEPVTGRVAFRYFVTSGGGDLVTVDAFNYVSSVPEESALAMMTVGLIGLAGLIRRRRVAELNR